MLKKTQLTAIIASALMLATPLSWADNSTSNTQSAGKTLSTKDVKKSDNKQVDRSDWISFHDALDKLEKEGHKEIISLTQTMHGYYARVVDKDGNVKHLIIHPTKGSLVERDPKELRHHRHGQIYRSHGSQMKKGQPGRHHHGQYKKRPHTGSHGQHPHHGKGGHHSPNRHEGKGPQAK